MLKLQYFLNYPWFFKKNLFFCLKDADGCGFRLLKGMCVAHWCFCKSRTLLSLNQVPKLTSLLLFSLSCSWMNCRACALTSCSASGQSVGSSDSDSIVRRGWKCHHDSLSGSVHMAPPPTPVLPSEILYGALYGTQKGVRRRRMRRETWIRAVDILYCILKRGILFFLLL